MLEENRGILDEGTWQIVYSFFHPEEGMDAGVADSVATSPFVGLFSDAIGITSSPVSASVQRFYSGRPACLVWSADENTEEKNFWRAEIMVTTGLGFEESVLVTVTDSHGESIDAAKLILLNSTLEVSDGTATYSLAEFQRNLRNTNVALIYPDGRRVPGGFSLDVF